MKKFLLDILAMVKQLVCQTFFMALTSAGLRCKKLISIISKLSNLKINEDNEKISLHDRCELMNINPVLVARDVQQRMGFFKERILNGRLDKTKYYTIRVQFQVCGSQQCVFVFMDTVLNKDNGDEYFFC